MPKGLQTQFQRGHDVEFGLEVTERDKKSGTIKHILCRVCLKFGREPRPGQKHKRTTNLHSSVHSAPTIPKDIIRRPIQRSWDEFSIASFEGKLHLFLSGVVNHSSMSPAHFESKVVVLSLARRGRGTRM
jgi:hypothetical protein